MEFNRDSVIPNVKFDTRLKRYRYIDTGKFLSKEASLNITKRFINLEKNKLIGLTEQLQNGEIDLFRFQLRAAEHLKHIHLSQAVLSADGLENLSSIDFLTVGRMLKKQYYSGIAEDGTRFGIKHLAQDILEGKVTPGRLRQRLTLFADSGQQTYWQIKRDMAKDRPYEVRVLSPYAQHCASCLSYAARGPQPLGRLPLPSENCECRTNCACSLLQLTLEEAVLRGLSVSR